MFVEPMAMAFGALIVVSAEVLQSFSAVVVEKNLPVHHANEV